MNIVVPIKLVPDLAEELEINDDGTDLERDFLSYRINEICDGLRNISPEMALRLSKAFRTTPEFWLNLQQQYDL